MKLSEDLKSWRAERPDEWTMDRFIKAAEKLEAQQEDLRKVVVEMRTSTIRWGDDDNIPDTFEESWDEAGLVWADRIDQLIKGEG